MGSATGVRAACVFGALLATGCDVETIEGEVQPAEFRDLVLITKPDVAEIDAPLPAAFCSIKVVGQTTYDLESDYLPRVVWCENGGADFEALKAQAIAARSVAYYEAALDGSICDGEACQAASCKGSAAATLDSVPEEVFRAVEETSGMYLSYGDTLTYAFFVAGSKSFVGETCIGKEGGAPTEKWVTYNNGKDATAVEQTKLGTRFDPSDNEYGQNRGCMSQWGARCLEEAGAETIDILQFYYGEDIEVVQADGDCVDPNADIGGGADDAHCGDGVCTGSENEETCSEDCEPCGVVVTDESTVIDETDSCFSATGDDEYLRVDEEAGLDGLVWTETTEFESHNVGTWHFNFAEPGEYALEVYVEPGYADESEARYRLTHNGHETNIRLDQSRAGGWVRLGIFDFEAGHKDQSLELTDLSGTRDNTIVFDAIRLTPRGLDDHGKGDEVPIGARGRGAAQGCSVGGAPSGAAWSLMLAMLGLARLRRRR